MLQTQVSKSAALRARLGHPVIDSDGHTLEFGPGVLDHLNQVGGPMLVDSFKTWRAKGLHRWYGLSPEERRDKRATRITWWGMPTKNTRDRATAGLPKLLYERLDEFGLDYSILYPTLGLPIPV